MKVTKTIGKQTYDVDCKTKLVTYQSRSKSEKKFMLKQMIDLKLQDRWMKIPSYVATLERQCFKELIDSI